MPSVPASVNVLLAVSVLPFATANVLDVAGAVIAILLMLVAVATPKTGVTNVGEADIAKVVPVPVWLAMLVALPTDVIGPVKLALVVTVAALPVHEPELPLTLPVTLPVNGPEKPVAVITPADIVAPALSNKVLPPVPLKVGMAKFVLDAGPVTSPPLLASRTTLPPLSLV